MEIEGDDLALVCDVTREVVDVTPSGQEPARGFLELINIATDDSVRDVEEDGEIGWLRSAPWSNPLCQYE